MSVIVSKYAGFCPGVRRADDEIKSLIAKRKKGERIYTLGKLIHNDIYISSLEKLGVFSVSIEELESVLYGNKQDKITLVIRTHGITLDEEEALRTLSLQNPNFDVVDLTCPYVKRLHKIAESADTEKEFVVVVGDSLHAEVRGIVSKIKGEYALLRCESDVKYLKTMGKIPILCAQTTQNLYEFEKIKKIFKKLYTNVKIFDTICNVTENRQIEAVKIASRADLMIVVGGKESSNTKKLYELCKSECPDTRWIESSTELTDFPDSAKCTGITAGASTPDGVILEVLKSMENENFVEMLEGSLKTLHTGETVTGTVFTVGENEIKLDLGAKFTGVLTKEQITDDPSAKLSEMFKVGDELEVFVIRVEDGKGIATVSKKRVDADNSWVILKDAYENGTTLEGKIVSAIKGGVLLSVSGNTVFIPASQTGIARGGDLSTLVGTTQKIKVLEFDTAKKRALGSIKVILSEEKKAREEAMWASLEVGAQYVGVVKNLTNYGAFVDIGGVDGMVHNSELSWKRIKHPSQVVSVGQQIKV